MDTEELGTIGMASGLGCSIVASLVVFIVGGIFLDRWLHTTPVLLLIGVGIGLIAAGYQLYELTLLGRSDKVAGPVTRILNRTLGSRREPNDQTK
ncbi:MAG: AtpZ/AtpI family protein [Thermomicrobiales bacterium]